MTEADAENRLADQQANEYFRKKWMPTYGRRHAQEWADDYLAAITEAFNAGKHAAIEEATQGDHPIGKPMRINGLFCRACKEPVVWSGNEWIHDTPVIGPEPVEEARRDGDDSIFGAMFNAEWERFEREKMSPNASADDLQAAYYIFKDGWEAAVRAEVGPCAAVDEECATCGHAMHAPMRVAGRIVKWDTYCSDCNSEHPFVAANAHA